MDSKIPSHWIQLGLHYIYIVNNDSISGIECGTEIVLFSAILNTSRPAASRRESEWVGDKCVGLEMCDMKEKHT